MGGQAEMKFWTLIQRRHCCAAVTSGYWINAGLRSCDVHTYADLPSMFLMSTRGVVGLETWSWSERGSKSSARDNKNRRSNNRHDNWIIFLELLNHISERAITHPGEREKHQERVSLWQLGEKQTENVWQETDDLSLIGQHLAWWPPHCHWRPDSPLPRPRVAPGWRAAPCCWPTDFASSCPARWAGLLAARPHLH